MKCAINEKENFVMHEKQVSSKKVYEMQEKEKRK